MDIDVIEKRVAALLALQPRIEAVLASHEARAAAAPSASVTTIDLPVDEMAVQLRAALDETLAPVLDSVAQLRADIEQITGAVDAKVAPLLERIASLEATRHAPATDGTIVEATSAPLVVRDQPPEQTADEAKSA